VKFGSYAQRVLRPAGARPPIQVLRDFIDRHRDTYGVEPICKLLQITPVWLSTLCRATWSSMLPGFQRRQPLYFQDAIFQARTKCLRQAQASVIGSGVIKKTA
jgi:hypothetical protein